MLYWIAAQLGFPGVLNLFRYQTFRTGAAVATALLIGLIIGPKFIGWLRVRQGKGQPIRSDGPQTHLAKRGTPTMGGLMILTSLMISILLWMDLTNPFVWACLFVTLRVRDDRFPRRLRQGAQGEHRGRFGQGAAARRVRHRRHRQLRSSSTPTHERHAALRAVLQLAASSISAGSTSRSPPSRSSRSAMR